MLYLPAFNLYIFMFLSCLGKLKMKALVSLGSALSENPEDENAPIMFLS